MVILHILICGMHELLCASYTIFVHGFVWLINVCMQEELLYILMGIRLPSVPVSVIYLHAVVIWLLFVFSLAVITDLMHGHWKSFIWPFHTPVLPPQLPQHLGACHELLYIFLLPSLDTFLLWLLHSHLKFWIITTTPNPALAIDWTSGCIICVTICFMASKHCFLLLYLISLSGPFASEIFWSRTTLAHWCFHLSFDCG